jgi:flagellar biosynthetic protein FliO
MFSRLHQYRTGNRAKAVLLCGFLATMPVALNAADTAAFATLPGSAAPDMTASAIRVVGALILVIALFFGGVWLFRNWRRFAKTGGNTPRLRVIEARSLGQRQSVFVIGYREQRMLLASSPTGITLVSHLPAEEDTVEKTVEAPAPGAPMSFAQAFQQVLNRR